MVETYSQNANHNMRRPVVDEGVLNMMRERSKKEKGALAELEAFAKEHNIPIIPKETASYFRFMVPLLKPRRILEIGTAIGYSALLLADCAPEAEIVTIDRNEEMLGLARANFAKYDTRRQITQLEGEAQELLPTLAGEFDLVFMDSAKSKYIVFLPHLLPLMPVGGVVLIDDVFQGGDVARPILEVRRGQRTIYRGLQALFDATLDNDGLTSSLLPLGDGLLMVRKDVPDVKL